MQARMTNPALLIPEAMQALWALKAAIIKDQGVPESTFNLIEQRASQINGCGVCLDMHTKAARKAGETEERLSTVAAWREVPYFTDAERAALALTEAVTQLSVGTDPIPDHVWNEAARHYDERGLAAVVLAIANINVWNRLNVAVQQPLGEWKGD